MAGALGTAQSLISDLESGQRRLDMAELKVLARLYDKPPAWFFD